jgi:hypothetical protein
MLANQRVHEEDLPTMRVKLNRFGIVINRLKQPCFNIAAVSALRVVIRQAPGLCAAGGGGVQRFCMQLTKPFLNGNMLWLTSGAVRIRHL